MEIVKNLQHQHTAINPRFRLVNIIAKNNVFTKFRP